METEVVWMSSERQQEILRRLVVDRVLRTKELAHEYGVHEMTIRRDLDALAEHGQVTRIHGGVRLPERRTEELSYVLRATHNPEAKDRIARAAAALIQPGDAIALDASTTCLALARNLTTPNITAFVTGLDAAEVLAAAGIPFVLLGGQFHPPARSFVGGLFTENLARLHPDKVFFSAKGYTAEAGFTDPYFPEVEAKSALIRSGGTAIALMDGSKFGRKSLATVARARDIDIVVTDAPPPIDLSAAFDHADVRLIIADLAHTPNPDRP